MEPVVMDHLAHLLVVRLREDELMRRRLENVGLLDRTARILGGSAAMVVSGVLIHAHIGMTIVFLTSVAVILLGLALIVSGVRGCCPIYQRLGWSTSHLHSSATITSIG